MNLSDTRPFHFTTASGADIFIFHYLRKAHLHELSALYRVLVAIESLFLILYAFSTAFLVYGAFRHPPVHMNLVIITNYAISMLALSGLGRFGQILFETEILGVPGVVSGSLIISSYIRLFGYMTTSRYSMAIYLERCLALRFVRDYEKDQRLYIGMIYIIQDLFLSNLFSYLIIYDYIPGYPIFLISIIPHGASFYLIKKLLKENEKRLEKLNSRDRRPTISKMGLLLGKLFGDRSQDMYTLSLRVQLDENIWCCKQLAKGNDAFILAMAFVIISLSVPPLFSYSEGTEWILNLLMMLANSLFPIAALITELLIAWSLDKLRPHVFPAWFIGWITRSKGCKSSGSSKVSPHFKEQMRIEEEAKHYFDQLSQQWDCAYQIVKLPTNN